MIESENSFFHSANADEEEGQAEEMVIEKEMEIKSAGPGSSKVKTPYESNLT
jgi:hypothetical protein